MESGVRWCARDVVLAHWTAQVTTTGLPVEDHARQYGNGKPSRHGIPDKVCTSDRFLCAWTIGQNEAS